MIKKDRRTYTKFVGDFDDLVKSSEVGVHDDGRMDILFKEAFNCRQDLTSEDDDRGGTISDFFVLGSGELDHALSSWMLHVNLSQDGVSIIGQDNTAHWVEQHLKHALWTESSPNDVRDSLHSPISTHNLHLPWQP